MKTRGSSKQNYFKHLQITMLNAGISIEEMNRILDYKFYRNHKTEQIREINKSAARMVMDEELTDEEKITNIREGWFLFW